MGPRAHELECCHGIGHQMGLHGCDGCCDLIFGGLVDQTEERIIKLLEEQKKTYSSPKYSTTGGFIENFALDQAIELIKGETK